jgi:hypothetical protein
MKKLVIILLVTILTSCACSPSKTKPTSNTDYENIIGTPIKIDNLIENLEVAQYDFPERMKWDDARKNCESLGDGWRLPTMNELGILYIKKDVIGNFTLDDDLYYYWSSTGYPGFGSVYSVNFTNGRYFGSFKRNQFHVRAVRTF